MGVINWGTRSLDFGSRVDLCYSTGKIKKESKPSEA